MQQKYGFGIEIVSYILSTSFNSTIIELVADEGDDTPIYINDIVKTVENISISGKEICTRASANDIIRGVVVGVSAERQYDDRIYRKGNEKRIIKVCQDPFVLCRAMVNDIVDINTDVHYTLDVDDAGGNSHTGKSNVQLDYATLRPDAGQFRIHRVLQVVDTEEERYSIVECVIVNHELIRERISTHTYWLRSGDDLIPDFEANLNLLGTGRGKQFQDPVDDQDVVTKNYLVNYIEDHPGILLWDRVGGDLIPRNAGDNVNLQHGGRGEGFLDPVDDYDVVNKRFLIDYLSNFPVLAATPQVEELVVTSDGQTAFTIDFEPISPAAITVSVNGIMFYANQPPNPTNYGFDVDKPAKLITWTEPYGIELKTTDRVMCHYNYVFAEPVPPNPAKAFKRDIVNVATAIYTHDIIDDLGKVFTNRDNPSNVVFVLPTPAVEYKGTWWEYMSMEGINLISVQAPAGEPLLYNNLEIPEVHTANEGARMTVVVTNELRWAIMTMDNNWYYIV